MSSNDGLGILIFLSVIAGLIWGVISGNKKQKQPIQSDKTVKKAKKYRVKDDLSLEDSEFDGEILFDDPLFPPESFTDEDKY